MKKRVLVRHLLPFILLFSLMIFFAIVVDYVLHLLNLLSIGRYLGYVGTAIILISFIYSLRKRKLIESGSPKQLLLLHEYLAWIGTVVLLVHAGIHFNALLPWLATFMLLISVASGLVGKYLLKEANELLKSNKQHLLNKGISSDDADKKLFFDSVAVDAMKKWRLVHLPITFLVAGLSFVHILTVLLFQK
ncbi:MAG: hypothetical protein PSX36_09400 [bacterium]|nr:hypothetical protein [bacterium]